MLAGTGFLGVTKVTVGGVAGGVRGRGREAHRADRSGDGEERAAADHRHELGRHGDPTVKLVKKP